jgi:hypothetical protein
MVTLVGCANSYNLLFLCSIIYLDYFWCIKYQHINIYVKMGKKKWEKKKEKVFLASWAREGDFGPLSAGAWARARLRPSWPSCEGATAGDGAVVRAHKLGRERGLTALTATEGGEISTGVRPATNPAAALRRWSGPLAGKRWRSTGGCRGSRGWV